MIRSLLIIVEPLFNSPSLPSAFQVKRIEQVAMRRACSRRAVAVSPPTASPMRPIHSRIEPPRLTSLLPVTIA